ncbi:sulfate adenylyltransferase subunit 1 [Amphibiibacter pelophylacis]|uniref:GTP-binding protein n=1 Tax=Amphibiibacter pelophylacis TaxID=1799477 RepID=A0ACC6P1G9_9BURK
MSALDDEARHKALRLLTAGSVDDGKSTLMGRLLLDSRAVLTDQLDMLEQRAAGSAIDLSLLTDGLEAEREQGITIDVAYRYFATKKRKFIMADAPGHEQYTRNMVTAASSSDVAVILVDITKLDWRTRPVALLPQTRRHSLLAQLLRVPHVVFVINKLDAVDADAQAAFEAVRDALDEFARHADLPVRAILPVSALRGDNVTQPSSVWTWYTGPCLLPLLEELPVTTERLDGAPLMAVQYVSRDGGTGHQLRTFWGRLAQGQVRVGDTLTVYPSGESATVQELWRAAEAVTEAHAGQSVGVVLDRQLDVSRGDWLLPAGESAASGQSEFDATLAWLDTEPARVGRKYWLRHGHRWVQARITRIVSRLDVQTLHAHDTDELAVNDIGRVVWQTQQPLPLQTYHDNRSAGAMIVVDPASHRTGGAVLVEPSAPHEVDDGWGEAA